MNNRAIVMLDLPEDQDIEDLFEPYDAQVIYQRDLLELDPRQSEIIKSLLLAVDLPVDLMRMAHNMMLASFINEGATIGAMGAGNRREMLTGAREVIDEMLREIP